MPGKDRISRCRSLRNWVRAWSAEFDEVGRAWSGLVADEANIDFPLYECPLGRGAQGGEQLVECSGIRWGVVEPGEKIERLVAAEVPTVVQSPGKGSLCFWCQK
ncbi:MAG: hypothetical protein ABIN08_24610 [Caldimonas sp.]